MKFARAKIILILSVMLISLFSCDFLSETGKMATVMIPLDYGDGSGGSRAISRSFIPAGVTITGFTISVFGPGMLPVKKYVSSGAKYVNLQIPAGQERNFKVEVHFTYDGQLYPYTHVRSFVGRSVVDLRPGSTVGLTMRMTAGATQLLAPDKIYGRVPYAEDITSFDGDRNGMLG